jgi:ketosteroid isomerase-like protein
MRPLGGAKAADAVLDTAGYGMGTFAGREAIRGFLRDWSSSFEDLTVEADEIVGLGAGVVLSVYHQEGRPIGSTSYVRVSSATVSEFVNGSVIRVTIYPDIDEARGAADQLVKARGTRSRSRT